MKYYTIILSLIFFCNTHSYSQELNAKVSINAQKIQSTSREVFTTLQSSLNQLMNEQKWTDASFSRNERIDCSITITVTEIVSENSFRGEIQVLARRPVYNSSYLTQTINYRDTQFEFNYQQGQSIDFNSLTISDNLVATLTYYAYIIIGLDFDSFSLNGGRQYFTKALNIANSAQTLNTKGWEPFANNGNRYDLALALTDDSSKDFHTAYYKYHRLGLDEMAANPSRGRIRIIETIADLQKLYEARPSSPLFTLFAEAKIDELVKICSEASAEEKSDLKKKLIQLFPTKSNVINNLK